VGERLRQPDAAGRGFVLDGVPRNIEQAKELERIVAPNHLDLAVSLEVPLEVVLERLATRMVCVDCQTNYSPQNRPKVPGICDVCGGEVISRRDDNEQAIRTRLELYEKQTLPLLDYYDAKGMLLRIDGSGNVDDVTLNLITSIDAELSRRRSK
jgi:adenylate kinase